jgi:hypothetical protein
MKPGRAVELFEGVMEAVATDANKRQVNCHGSVCKRASNISKCTTRAMSSEYPRMYATASPSYLSPAHQVGTPMESRRGVVWVCGFSCPSKQY